MTRSSKSLFPLLVILLLPGLAPADDGLSWRVATFADQWLAWTPERHDLVIQEARTPFPAGLVAFAAGRLQDGHGISVPLIVDPVCQEVLAGQFFVDPDGPGAEREHDSFEDFVATVFAAEARVLAVGEGEAGRFPLELEIRWGHGRVRFPAEVIYPERVYLLGEWLPLGLDVLAWRERELAKRSAPVLGNGATRVTGFVDLASPLTEVARGAVEAYAENFPGGLELAHLLDPQLQDPGWNDNAGAVAVCLRDSVGQAAFWDFETLVFARRGELWPEGVVATGLDVAAVHGGAEESFQICRAVDDPWSSSLTRVLEEMALSYRLAATQRPGHIVDGRLFVGAQFVPYLDLKARSLTSGR